MQLLLGSWQPCHVGLSLRHEWCMGPDGLGSRRQTLKCAKIYHLAFWLCRHQAAGCCSPFSRMSAREETCLTLLQSDWPHLYRQQRQGSSFSYERTGGPHLRRVRASLPLFTAQKLYRTGWSRVWRVEWERERERESMFLRSCLPEIPQGLHYLPLSFV